MASSRTVPRKSNYDVAIIGAGHNGLVAACYLARAGLSVVMLEKNAIIGGATKSAQVFEGIEARISVYAYLISLFPQKIADDLGIDLALNQRRIASFTPHVDGSELLVSNVSESETRASFEKLTGNDRDYQGYLKLQAMQQHLADHLWPTLLEPLRTRDELGKYLSTEDEKAAWRAIVEEPLGNVIERLVDRDLVRGMLFTDAKIGVSTTGDDPTLLQNRTFLYHIIGRGSGEWRTPTGGMGAVVAQLEQLARKLGVEIVCDAPVTTVDAGSATHEVNFENDGNANAIGAKFVLYNAAPPRESGTDREDEGSVFKINMLLSRLPKLRSTDVSAADAFTGTFHIDEGYEKMDADFRSTQDGRLPDNPASEIYCHSLTDDSILSPELRAGGAHTLTCFGLDAPYHLFEFDNHGLRETLLTSALQGLNQYLAEPIEECLASDANGRSCIEIKTPLDLEAEIGLPRGNIFHNAPSWPFAESAESAGTWGVETDEPRIYVCGSSARRGGCVSGIPGHNAAMKVLSEL